MIEKMEDLILAGMSIPLTPMTIVNGDKLVPLLDRIRESLPDVIQQAQKVIDHRDELLNDSQGKASQMLQDAKSQAERLLSESELLKAVHTEAERIRHQVLSEIDALRKQAQEEIDVMKAKAYEEARVVKEGADQYAESMLTSLDKSVSDFQTVIRNGQKHLKRVRSEASHNPKLKNAMLAPVQGVAIGPSASSHRGVEPMLAESLN